MKKMQTPELDVYDRRLLQALQADGRLSHVELSEQVYLSASQCQRRLKKLEDTGIIRRYVALLDADKLGLGVMAILSVTLEKHGDDPARAFKESIAGHPQILECWSVTGEADYVMRVVAPDLKAFSDFLMHELLNLPLVAGVRSNILLEQIKFTTELPLRPD